MLNTVWLMLNTVYRRTRRALSPVHPNRLYAKARAAGGRWRARIGRRLGALHPRHIAVTWRWLASVAAVQRQRRGEPRLTVAVDISALYEPLTGIGWYLYRLLEHLAEREDLRLRLYGPNLIDTPDLPAPQVEVPRGAAIELVRYRVPEDISLPYSLLVRFLRACQAWMIAADRNRLLFAPNYFLPPWFERCRGKLVVTVHDLSFERVPWTMQDETRLNLARNLRRSVERAAGVLTDTHTVREELIASGMVEPARVHAIHLGPGPTATLGSEAPRPDMTPAFYALHVGTLEPRKNLSTLLVSWRDLQQSASQAGVEWVPSLVLCGRFGWKSESLRQQVADGEQEGWLHHFGYLPDTTLAALYRHAWLLVMPSIYEGFGLPLVEAMSFGKSLVCSDIPVLREVAGGAALHIPAEDPAAWTAALTDLLRRPDRVAELARASAHRSNAFDWHRTAEQTAAIWHRLMMPTSQPSPDGEEGGG